MAKIQIKSEKQTPFGGLFSIMEQFDSTLSSVIDSTLGLRCRSFGYQYSEIIRSLMSIYFCGGSCTPGCHYSFDEPSLASSDISHFSPVLERIDDRAFSYCDSLENVSFPPVLKNILEIILLSQ